MAETRSRVLLAVEAVIICLPITALFLVLVLPSSLYFATDQANSMSIFSAGTSAIIFCTLVCAWWLIGVFLARGATALRATAFYWWVLPFTTALLGLLAALHVSFTPVLRPSAFNIFAWGLPCIFPLAPLAWERWSRAQR